MSYNYMAIQQLYEKKNKMLPLIFQSSMFAYHGYPKIIKSFALYERSLTKQILLDRQRIWLTQNNEVITLEEAKHGRRSTMQVISSLPTRGTKIEM